MKKKELKSEIKFIRWLDKQGLSNTKIAKIINERRKAIKEIKKTFKKGSYE